MGLGIFVGVDAIGNAIHSCWLRKGQSDSVIDRFFLLDPFWLHFVARDNDVFAYRWSESRFIDQPN